MIDPHSPLPRYAQLEEILATEILTGAIPLDSRLPTEDALIARYGVSRTTVRKAIQNLVARGLAETRHGLGTFVTRPRAIQPLTALSGFVEDMEAQGRRATARLVGTTVVPADEVVAAHLALKPGTPVVRIERIRLADGIPFSFDETFLPEAIGHKILTHDLESMPIFTLLEETYRLPLKEAAYALEAVAAPDHIAPHLHLPPGAPIFLVERTSYGQDDTPLDYERLSYRGDLVRFETRLPRLPQPPATRSA